MFVNLCFQYIEYVGPGVGRQAVGVCASIGARPLVCYAVYQPQDNSQAGIGGLVVFPSLFGFIGNGGPPLLGAGGRSNAHTVTGEGAAIAGAEATRPSPVSPGIPRQLSRVAIGPGKPRLVGLLQGS